MADTETRRYMGQSHITCKMSQHSCEAKWEVLWGLSRFAAPGGGPGVGCLPCASTGDEDSLGQTSVSPGSVGGDPVL